jgi:hypothetical protein
MFSLVFDPIVHTMQAQRQSDSLVTAGVVIVAA